MLSADVIRLSADQFDALVEEALEQIPEDLRQAIDNVVVMVEDEPSVEDLESVGLDPEEDLLFGLYHGSALPGRSSDYAGLPDRIVIYRLPLLEACTSRRELLREIRATVIHEVGHYFGFDEEDLP